MLKKGSWRMLALACVASFVLMSGCEPSAAGSSTTAKTSASASERSGTRMTSLSISRSSATVSNQKKTANFTASGGSGDYEWELSTSDYGSLDKNRGSSVTYTSTYSGEAEVATTLTLRDAIGGDTKVATITHSPYAAGDTINVKK